MRIYRGGVFGSWVLIRVGGDGTRVVDGAKEVVERKEQGKPWDVTKGS